VAAATFDMYIDGQWVGADSDRRFAVTNPATLEEVGTVPDAGRAETRRAIEAAARAFPAWSGLTAGERARFLGKFAARVQANVDALAELLTREQGKPLAEARGEVLGTVDIIQWYAEEAKRLYGETVPASVPHKRILVLRQPVGVVGVITPWNYPISIIARKIATALAAGCTVVAKPAEQTPLCGVALVRLIAEAGLPAGVVNLVTGNPVEIGLELLSNPLVRKITFTGSTEVGKLLMRGAADRVKKVSLELGGHAPFIIFRDADLKQAVADFLYNKFRNNGQMCSCANRLYVEEDVYDQVVQQVAEGARRLRVGNGLEPGVQVGPLIDEAGLAKVEAQVRDARQRGARVLTGGQRLADLGPGSFYAPTVLTDVSADMAVCQEETFGPVIPVIPFRSEQEAVSLANASPYGLTAYFYTSNLSRAWRVAEQLECGVVGVNDSMPTVPQAPFGGFKESGIGREGGHHGLADFLEIKYVSIGLEQEN